ncbi:hypothetical protein B0J14DRAFT_655222 [Halenospora varia]|nr:hypothetical protein B0J14DRAFT_655222 [Halenospora varia]
MTVGIISFAAFIYIERHVARHPRSLSKEALYALSIIACGWASFGVWLYYLYQLFLRLRYHSTLSAAAQQVPVAIGGLLASLAVSFFIASTRVAYVMEGAMACFLAGQILLATTPVEQTYWAQTLVSQVIMPWGMDMSFPCGTIILSNAMPREHQGIVASMVNTVVNYSISISLSIAGTIVRYTDSEGTNVRGAIVMRGISQSGWMALGSQSRSTSYRLL